MIPCLVFFDIFAFLIISLFLYWDGKSPHLARIPDYSATLLKRDSTQMFSCEISKIFKNIFYTEHLQWLLLNELVINFGKLLSKSGVSRPAGFCDGQNFVDITVPLTKPPTVLMK